MQCPMFADEKNKVLRGNARCHGADVIDDESRSEITTTGLYIHPTPVLSPVAR